MKCNSCGQNITPVNHNNRGFRCPHCWARVAIEEPEAAEGPRPTEVRRHMVNATDAAKKLAEEAGVDLSVMHIQTGIDRIGVNDVRSWLEELDNGE